MLKQKKDKELTDYFNSQIFGQLIVSRNYLDSANGESRQHAFALNRLGPEFDKPTMLQRRMTTKISKLLKKMNECYTICEKLDEQIETAYAKVQKNNIERRVRK